LPGSRMPGVWMSANSTQLQIAIGTNELGDWTLNAPELPLKQTTFVNITAVGQNIIIYYNGSVVSNAVLPPSAQRVTGSADLYVSDMFSYPANMVINKLQINVSTDASLLPSEFFKTRTLPSSMFYDFINISSNYALHFSIQMPSTLSTSMSNILHFTTTGNDAGTSGSRAPSVWLMSTGTSAALFMESNMNDQTWSLSSSNIPLNTETKVHLIVNGTFVGVYFNGVLVSSTTATLPSSNIRKTQLYLGYGSSYTGVSIGSLFVSKLESQVSLATYLSSITRYSGSLINTFGFASSVADRFISDNRAITPVTFMSESQLIAFLNFNLGVNPSLHKRQLASISTDTSMTSYYLSLCPLNSISSNSTGNNQILAGCLAGVTQTCQQGDTDKCRTYWSSVYEYSVFKPIQPCLPWNSGASSSTCNSTIVSYCATPGLPFYQCAFAKTSQNKLFTNPTYVPCSKDVFPYKCIY